jgi:hypothetical protein
MRAAIVARGTVIGVDHLILEGVMGAARSDLTLKAAIGRHVGLVLDHAGGDRSAASEILGISREELDTHLALTEPPLST